MIGLTKLSIFVTFNNLIYTLMKFITFLKKQMTLALAVGVLLSLNSCGSFQYSGIYEDGIYSESKPAQQVNETVDNTSNSSTHISPSMSCDKSIT